VGIELTVAMPLYRAKDIAWLSFESLCAQKGIDFGWELVVAEECGDKSYQEFGLNEIMKYAKRLNEVGCTKIKYIKLSEWIPLSMKYHLIGKESAPSSEVFLVQQADYYSPPFRLLTTMLKVSEGYDWVHGNRMYLYNLLDGTLYKRERNTKKYWMSTIMDLAKKLPFSNKKRGVDQYLWDSCVGLCGGEIKKYEVSDWGDGLVVHGINNLSKKFHKLHPEPCDKVLSDILPPRIAERLMNCSKISSSWKITIPHFKEKVFTEPPNYELTERLL